MVLLILVQPMDLYFLLTFCAWLVTDKSTYQPQSWLDITATIVALAIQLHVDKLQSINLPWHKFRNPQQLFSESQMAG